MLTCVVLFVLKNNFKRILLCIFRRKIINQPRNVKITGLSILDLAFAQRRSLLSSNIKSKQKTCIGRKRHDVGAAYPLNMSETIRPERTCRARNDILKRRVH